MFSDPQSVTVAATPVSLPRITAGDRKGIFRNPDGSLSLTVSHADGKRERSLVRLDRSKIGADLLDPTKQRPYQAAVWLVVDAPLNGVGFTDAELSEDIKALCGLVTKTDFIARFLGKEA